MAGLVPAISVRGVQCRPKRGHRDKRGGDKKNENGIRPYAVAAKHLSPRGTAERIFYLLNMI
jgi:hypothetical protein